MTSMTKYGAAQVAAARLASSLHRRAVVAAQYVAWIDSKPVESAAIDALLAAAGSSKYPERVLVNANQHYELMDDYPPAGGLPPYLSEAALDAKYALGVQSFDPPLTGGRMFAIGQPNTTDDSYWYGGGVYIHHHTFVAPRDETIVLRNPTNADEPDDSNASMSLWLGANVPSLGAEPFDDAGISYWWVLGDATVEVLLRAGATYTLILEHWNAANHVGQRFDTRDFFVQVERPALTAIEGRIYDYTYGPDGFELLERPRPYYGSGGNSFQAASGVADGMNSMAGAFGVAEGDAAVAFGSNSLATGTGAVALSGARSDRDYETALIGHWDHGANRSVQAFHYSPSVYAGGVSHTTDFLLEGRVALVTAHVLYYTPDFGKVAAFELRGLFARPVGEQTARPVGTPTSTKLFGDASTASWTASLTVSSYRLQISSNGFGATDQVGASITLDYREHITNG